MLDNVTKLAEEPDRDTDEKLFFGDNDDWSIRYDGDGSFAIRDENADEDILKVTDGGEKITTDRDIEIRGEDVVRGGYEIQKNGDDAEGVINFKTE